MGLFKKSARESHSQASDVGNEGLYLSSAADEIEEEGEVAAHTAKDTEELEQLRQERLLLREQNQVLQSSLDEYNELSESIVHEKHSMKQEYDEQLAQYKEEQERIAKEYQEKHDKRYEQLSLENVELQANNERLVQEKSALEQAIEVEKLNAAAKDTAVEEKEEGNEEAQTSELKQQVSALNERVVSLDGELAALREQNQVLGEEKQELQKQIQACRMNESKPTVNQGMLEAQAECSGQTRPDEAEEEKEKDRLRMKLLKLNEKIEELNAEVAQKTTALMEQGEKNYQLFDSLARYKEEAIQAQASLKEARTLLLQEIAGDSAQTEDYQNVQILELIRLLVNRSSPLETHMTSSLRTASKISSQESIEEGSPNDTAPSIKRFFELDAECKLLKSNQRKQLKEIERLKKQSSRSNEVVHEKEVSRQRAEDLAQKLQTQKMMKARVEQELGKSNKRIQTLSQHIEKLMIHLKHEASAKIKAQESQRQHEAEAASAKQKLVVLQKKARSRSRLIHELKEGSRILEDQLRLMDKKYVDLRTKLDWTRASSNKEVRRIQKEANKLRAKFSIALANGALAGSMMQDIEEMTRKRGDDTEVSESEDRFPEDEEEQGETIQVEEDVLEESDAERPQGQEAKQRTTGGFKSASLSSFESIANTYSTDGAKKAAGEILPAIDSILPKSANERYQPRE